MKGGRGYHGAEGDMAMSRNAQVSGELLRVAQKALPSDLETPVSAFLKIKKAFGHKPAFLLESVERGEQVGRFSILGFDSEEILRWRVGEKSNPSLLLQKALNDFSKKADLNLPFPCGCFGYFSYDAIRAFEKIPGPKEKSPFPDVYFFVPRRMVLFDHVRNNMILLVIDNEKEREKGIAEMEKALSSGLPLHTPDAAAAGKPFRSSETKESFMQKVEKGKEYIRAGDIFQVVISQQLEGEAAARGIDIYRALRILNPSPYMYFLDFNTFQIIGSSPEMLLRVKDGIAETRPIAGTRPRGKTLEEDLSLSKQLLADQKERAEHIMLVDLGRNDLGRSCSYGSVKVTSFMDVEHYSHVMHLVSTIQGRVKEGNSSLDVLQAAFPAGTVTGAPKVRAMQIIEELESVARGPYGGCVGYVSFSGDLDTAITIRTILMQGDRVLLQAGAGIVADSNPEMEYQETLNKLEGMRQAIRMAENGLRL